MRILAIVVTYNRLPLLKECLAALQAQTRRPDDIIVINNGSTDDTEAWLRTQAVTTITQANSGGAGGFHTGIREAYERGADWTWLMDDDTIPTPTALEHLVRSATSSDNVGFAGSKVEWTDGSPHLMNLPDIRNFVGRMPFNRFDEHGFYIVNASSFVSLLLSREAVRRVGLPIKEYFIWNDDAEYTERITRSGFLGGYVPGSVVLHKTPANHFSDIYHDDVKGIWKYRHGIRNELHTYRMRKGKFWGRFLKRVFVIPVRILKRRKDHKWEFIKVNWQAAFEAVKFKPTIDTLP